VVVWVSGRFLSLLLFSTHSKHLDGPPVAPGVFPSIPQTNSHAGLLTLASCLYIPNRDDGAINQWEAGLDQAQK
jgi:hypothetical protein